MWPTTMKRKWFSPGRFNRKWDDRARRAVILLEGSRWVCDVGCGAQTLRRLLPTGTRYLPADLRKWTSDTETCNLNLLELPTRSLNLCDSVVVLGVFEYLKRSPGELVALFPRNVSRVVLSYHVRSYDTDRRRTRRGRERQWNTDDIVAQFEALGFSRDYSERLEDQVLFRFVRPTVSSPEAEHHRRAYRSPFFLLRLLDRLRLAWFRVRQKESKGGPNCHIADPAQPKPRSE
jgi:hypothetical protein